LELAKIAFKGGVDRYAGVKSVLQLLADEIVDGLKKAKRILVKPNFVSVYNIYSATHVDSVKAFLDFLYEAVGSKKVVIGEGPAGGGLERDLRNYGYLKLVDEYDVEFVDLNEDERVFFKIYDRDLEQRIEVPVSKTALNSDCIVSICRLKTHNTVVVTLTIKNVVMGAVQSPYKSRVHQGYGAINLTLAFLAKYLMPKLSIIDGYEGMEGNGPVSGSPVKWGIYVAGTNPVEVDAFTAWLMGFNPSDVGYLYFLSKWGYGEIDPNKLLEKVIGDDPRSFRRKFKPHFTYEEQLRWKDEVEDKMG